MAQKYTYKGDRLTDINLKGKACSAVLRNGKCIRGKNSNMLVQFNDDQSKVVVLARLLRKI